MASAILGAWSQRTPATKTRAEKSAKKSGPKKTGPKNRQKKNQPKKSEKKSGQKIEQKIGQKKIWQKKIGAEEKHQPSSHPISTQIAVHQHDAPPLAPPMASLVHHLAPSLVHQRHHQWPGCLWIENRGAKREANQPSPRFFPGFRDIPSAAYDPDSAMKENARPGACQDASRTSMSRIHVPHPCQLGSARPTRKCQLAGNLRINLNISPMRLNRGLGTEVCRVGSESVLTKTSGRGGARRSWVSPKREAVRYSACAIFISPARREPSLAGLPLGWRDVMPVEAT